jgi:transcriptional regulator with XRE-family HTH domain
VSQFEHSGGHVRRAAARELRDVIARKQVKLADLSAASGIPRSSLHKKLCGSSNLTVDELVKLAIALDVPAADLITAVLDADDGASAELD